MTLSQNKCPNCGSTEFKEARQCPQYQDEPVCIDCCNKCEYYSTELYRCMYYVAHPKEDLESDLKKLKNKIANKEAQARYYYRNHKPWISERIEGELHWLYRDKRELEKRIDSKAELKPGRTETDC